VKKNISRGVSFSYNDTLALPSAGRRGGARGAPCRPPWRLGSPGDPRVGIPRHVERLLRARAHAPQQRPAVGEQRGAGAAPVHPQQAHSQSQQQLQPPQQQQSPHLQPSQQQQQQQQRVTSPRGPSHPAPTLNLPIGPLPTPSPLPSAQASSSTALPAHLPRPLRPPRPPPGTPGVSTATESLGLESREPSYEASQRPLCPPWVGTRGRPPAPREPPAAADRGQPAARARRHQQGRGLGPGAELGGLVSALLGIPKSLLRHALCLALSKGKRR